MSKSNQLPVIFNAAQVKSVEHITRDVFKVEMNNGYVLIVKGEAPLRGQAGYGRDVVDFTYDAMREVASGTRARSMDDFEVGQWWSLKDKSCTDAAAAQALKALYGDAQVRSTYVWMLVRLKEGLFSLKDVVDKDDTSEMLTVASALREPENLERLGRMLAVDLFVDNMDRFNFYRGTGGDGHGGIHFTNKNNVLFVRKLDGRILLKGLDTFHFSNKMAYLDRSVDEVSDATFGGDFWMGQWLNKEKELERIVESVCDGFNTVLVGKLMKVGYTAESLREYRLRRKHREAIIKHAKQAREELRQFCRGRLAQLSGRKPPTDGLRSRMQLMGWRA